MLKRHAGSSNGSITPYSAWRERIGISATTGWRWRRRGWIKTIAIAGRVYVSAEAIADFERRAAEGEFVHTGTGSAEVAA